MAALRLFSVVLVVLIAVTGVRVCKIVRMNATTRVLIMTMNK